VSVVAPDRAAAERVRCTALEVSLATPVAPGATGAVSLRFTVRGRRQDDRFGRDGATALLGNVIPVLAVEDDRGLHLDPYSHAGESFYSLSARWDTTLRLPARLRAATTGSVRSEAVRGGRRTVRVATAQARDFGLAVGRLRVTATTVAGVRVRAFAPPRLERVGRALRAARRAVSALGRRLRPYRAGELDVVLVDGGGLVGMEYPELVFAAPAPEVIAHEIAHQWWYALVGNDQYREPWLDESFASHAHERLHPAWNFCAPKRPYGQVPPRRRGIPLDATMGVFGRASPFAYAEVVYLAGSCALQRLERDIGRPRMTAFLRLLQNRFRHGVMRKSDVLDAIAEVAPRLHVDRWLRIAHLSRP
jgi:aminopeptidase N